MRATAGRELRAGSNLAMRNLKAVSPRVKSLARGVSEATERRIAIVGAIISVTNHMDHGDRLFTAVTKSVIETGFSLAGGVVGGGVGAVAASVSAPVTVPLTGPIGPVAIEAASIGGGTYGGAKLGEAVTDAYSSDISAVMDPIQDFTEQTIQGFARQNQEVQDVTTKTSEE